MMVIFFILLTFSLCYSEKELRNCQCGHDRVVWCKDDILNFEALSRKFEEEDGILDEVQKQLNMGINLCPWSKVSYGANNENYVPYCEIAFGPSEIPDQSKGEWKASILRQDNINHYRLESQLPGSHPIGDYPFCNDVRFCASSLFCILCVS